MDVGPIIRFFIIQYMFLINPESYTFSKTIYSGLALMISAARVITVDRWK